MYPLLEYLVEGELTGGGDRLNQTRIAIDVFGRNETFDPSVDSIVRVEIGRLRNKLREYYATDGRDDVIAFELPKGRYRPRIRSAEAAVDRQPQGDREIRAAPAAEQRDRFRGRLLRYGAIGVPLLAITWIVAEQLTEVFDVQSSVATANATRRALSVQTVPAREEGPRKGVAQYAGFSLHAGIGVEAAQREKLERLARYVSRPPVSVERLSLTAQGRVRYRLKTPYRDGTTDIVLEPLDFIARLAALVPPPRAHLTRYHGVFAANAALRAAITPAGRGSKARNEPERPMPKHVALNWARRLKRVFGIEIEQCARWGGRLEVIASIEEPELIERILAHRRERGDEEAMTVSLGARAPPQPSLF